MSAKIMEKIDVEGVKEEAAKAVKEIGRFTVLIAGSTGAGKSTLINAVFHGDFAKTGQGRPVSQAAKEYSEPGIPLTIIDTKGIEIGDRDATRALLIDEIRQRRQRTDASEHVHVAWLCIEEGPRRVEDFHTALAREIAGFGIPVILVITKARADRDTDGNSFKEVARGLAPAAKEIVRVRALKETDDEGVTKPPMGLLALIEATERLIPEGHRQAFIAAQKIDFNTKKTYAHKVVLTSVAAAAAIGLVPIPFSDAVLLVPLQVAMMAKISVIFGLSLSGQKLVQLVSGILSTIAGTLAGRAIVTGLLKLIPGFGTLVGGAIAAATAAALTSALGEAYIAVLAASAAKHPDEVPSSERIAQEMRELLKKRQPTRVG